MRFVRPPPLRPRDPVAVIAPAGPFDRALFDEGLALLAQRYEPRVAPDLFARSRYLAGNDARRRDELVRALTDPDIKGVFTARGGYGSMRLLPHLHGFEARPVVGFSDVTALHLGLQRGGMTSIHGPVLTQLARQPAHAVERLFSLLESREPAPALQGVAVVPGVVDGPLLGGNLAVLASLIGTPYLPPLLGAVLLLEDVGERPYELDRLFTQLKLAGVFDQVSALALGDFTRCEETDADYTSIEVLDDLVRELKLPCVRGLPIGHGELNLAVPLGITVRLDAGNGTLIFLEPAVEERR